MTKKMRQQQKERRKKDSLTGVVGYSGGFTVRVRNTASLLTWGCHSLSGGA